MKERESNRQNDKNSIITIPHINSIMNFNCSAFNCAYNGYPVLINNTFFTAE